MMCVSVVNLLVGIIAGITMGIQKNFVLASQVWLHILGGILLPTGIALVIVGSKIRPMPIVGSLVMVLAMALFMVVVFRNRTT